MKKYGYCIDCKITMWSEVARKNHLSLRHIIGNPPNAEREAAEKRYRQGKFGEGEAGLKRFKAYIEALDDKEATR